MLRRLALTRTTLRRLWDDRSLARVWPTDVERARYFGRSARVLLTQRPNPALEASEMGAYGGERAVRAAMAFYRSLPPELQRRVDVREVGAYYDREERQYVYEPQSGVWNVRLPRGAPGVGFPAFHTKVELRRHHDDGVRVWRVRSVDFVRRRSALVWLELVEVRAS